jgi:hypothetical protein
MSLDGPHQPVNLGHEDAGLQLTEGLAGEHAIGGWLKPLSLGGHHQLVNLGHQGAGLQLNEGPAGVQAREGVAEANEPKRPPPPSNEAWAS